MTEITAVLGNILGGGFGAVATRAGGADQVLNSLQHIVIFCGILNQMFSAGIVIKE